MNNNNFLKFFSIIAFIAFMLVSCWATVESLSMSLPWKKPFYWIVTVGIFVISSLGATLIVNSLNQRIRIDNRGWHLIGGVVLLLIFWVLFSLPTNTHTFFYNNKSEAVVSKDLHKTEMYLQQLSNTQVDKIIKAAQDEYSNKVWSAYNAFAAEYDNPINPGYGPEATKRLKELNEVLKEKLVTEPLVPKSGNHNSANARKQILRVYVDEIKNIIDGANKAIENKILLEKGIAKQKADKALKGIQNAEQMLEKYRMQNLTVPAADVKTHVVPVIQEGYDVITNNHIQVQFVNDYDKQLYSGVKDDKGKNLKNDKGDFVANECETSRLFNVFSIWQDYFKGKYKGMGFIYWILIAALVDIAGFIFFTIAFRRTE